MLVSNFTVNAVSVGGGTFTQIEFSEGITLSPGVFDTSTPQMSTSESIVSCPFRENITSGGLGYISGTISSISLERQIDGESEWITLQTFDASSGETQPFAFTLYDTYNANNVIYNYRLLPYDELGNEGDSFVSQVVSTFSNAYICDARTMYNITLEYNLGNKDFVQLNTLHQPYGAIFPFVGYNATLQYNQGSVSSVLLSPSSKINASLDRISQARLLKNFNSWMANRRAKILKDFNGNIFIVAITNNITNTYYKELGNGLAGISFNWVEVGLFEQKYIEQLGLANNFEVVYDS